MEDFNVFHTVHSVEQRKYHSWILLCRSLFPFLLALPPGRGYVSLLPHPNISRTFGGSEILSWGRSSDFDGVPGFDPLCFLKNVNSIVVGRVSFELGAEMYVCLCVQKVGVGSR